MTVKELINILKTFNQEAVVVDYENNEFLIVEYDNIYSVDKNTKKVIIK